MQEMWREARRTSVRSERDIRTHAGRSIEPRPPLGATSSLRAVRETSLTGLAQLAAVSKSNLSKIENDTISPTFDTIERIARGLKVRPEALLSDERPAAQAGAGAQTVSSDLQQLVRILADQDARVLWVWLG